jgi:hypothetical protein
MDLSVTSLDDASSVGCAGSRAVAATKKIGMENTANQYVRKNGFLAMSKRLCVIPGGRGSVRAGLRHGSP